MRIDNAFEFEEKNVRQFLAYYAKTATYNNVEDFVYPLQNIFKLPF